MERKLNNSDRFREIIDRFSSFIHAHIQKFNPQKSGIDPDDLAQQVKIKLWKILEDENKIKNYSSYIKKVVDSTVIDQLRKSRRQEGIIIHEKQKRISEQNSFYCSNITYNKNIKQIIDEAMNSLLVSRQKVVHLYLLNMTLEEISIFLNWSKDKTRNLLYRGLADLKKKLKELGIEYKN